MYFGTQYYRPPFPRREHWEEDIRHIKSLNFNVVKLWAVWNCIEKTPGVFDFSELDELVSICGKYGLKCIINTIPEGAPYWTATGFEDSFYKTSDGHILDYSGPANIPSAGWPGMCQDSAAANELVCRFINNTARHFKDNETVAAIDVWNEPHLEPMFDYSGKLLCYCGHSADKFRSWLKERYGSLEKLNDVWFRRYTSWEQVMPPSRFGTSTDMIDWRRFWLHNLAQWLRARVAAAREAAPDMPVQTHTAFSGYMGAENEGGLGNELGDEFLLAREVDAFGLSSFPLWLMGEKHVAGHLINVEIIAESSREKPFYQVELQGGAGKKGLLAGIVPSAEDIRLWNLNVIAAGGKGVVYWQFKPEPAGLESPGFGLVNPDGSDTPRSISAAECARRFSREDLANARRVLPQNGIYLSRSSDLLTYSVGEESKYNASFKGIYNLLLDKGIPVRFIHEDYLDKALDEGLKVLYLPMCLSLSAREKQLLAGFAQKGGTLVVEGCTGMYNEHGELDPYFTFLDSLFGMRNVWIEAIRGEHAYARTLNNSGSIGFMLYRQLFEKANEDCVEIARFDDGKTAALTRIIDDGKAIWISGFAGMEYNSTGHPETGDFMASLFAYPGYPAIEKMESQGMLVRMHEDNSHYYIVAVNYSDADKSLFVKMKNGKSAEAVIRARDGEVLKVGKL